jgi:hypothetical protein
MIAKEMKGCPPYTEIMSKPKTLTIQLSAEDSERLEAEAKKRNLPLDAMAHAMLRERLAQVKPLLDQHEALLRLREIGRKMPPIDAVQLARESREDLEQRGVF